MLFVLRSTNTSIPQQLFRPHLSVNVCLLCVMQTLLGRHGFQNKWMGKGFDLESKKGWFAKQILTCLTFSLM